MLIGNGAARAVIVADEADALAAEELQTYLTKMTGAEPRVVEQAADGPRIVLGGLAADECAQLDLGLDGFVIRREADALHLCGASPTGTQNAVCRLLDRLGVRWYIPGEIGEVCRSARRLRSAT